MKRGLILIIALMVIITLVGCGSSTTTSSTATTKTTSVTTTSTTASTSGPVSGGILRVIRNEGPMYFGYPPNADGFCRVFNTERLIDWDEEGNIIPELADSWDIDTQNETITWHIRQGVKFHDGTVFNAEAARWNMQMYIDLNMQQDGNMVTGFEVVDEYTLVESFTKVTSMAVVTFGWVQMFSPTAYNTNGAEWAETHQVATGPFKFVDWERDNYANFERFDDYWRGKPYLDGIKVIVIPDSVTASSMMQAGQADMWADAPTKFLVDLEDLGYKVNWGLGYFWALWPNSTDAGSIYTNKTVREALEYAIDRPSLAKTLGFGAYEALTQLVQKSADGYIEGYDPRPYNPDKARELLAEAGYPNGFETTILCSSTNQDLATAIQSYLGEVGIKASLDIADIGRYYSEFYSGFFGGGQGGFKDLVVGLVGINIPAVSGIIVHLGPTPMTGILGVNGAKSPEFISKLDKVLDTFDPVEMTKATQEVIKQASEDAIVVPLYRTPYGTAMQEYVYSDYELQHGVVWYCWDDWMDKH